MTHEDYVSFKTAQRLKKLGFNWECRNLYLIYPDNSYCFLEYPLTDHEEQFIQIPAPTFAQAARWLREEKGYHIKVEPAGNLWGYIIYEYSKEDECYWDFYICDEEDFSTYEEALSDAIDMITGLLEEGEKNERR